MVSTQTGDMASHLLTPAPPADVVAVSVRWSRSVLVGTLALSLVASALPAAGQNAVVLVLVAVGLVVGMPHGAVDHVLAARLTGRPTPVVAAAYAAVAALTWALLVTIGPLALVPVVALSLGHFALGELEVVRSSMGWRPGPVVAVAVAVAGTGALLLPLARSGPELAGVAASISPELGVLLAATPSRIGLAVFWAVAATLAGLAAVRARQPGVLLDIVLVGALGALAPPLVAFAAWFGGWHSLRHCARLLTVDESAAALIAAGHPRQAIRGLARVALGPTLAALVVLAGLVAVTASAADPAAAVGAALLVLLALTVPHMLVVLWLDRRSVRGPSA